MTDLQVKTVASTLRSLKGNDVKVFWAMWLLGAVNVGNKAIRDLAGITYPTISNALANLAALGLVTQTHRTTGWQITEGGFQLLLPTEASERFFHSEPIINIDESLNTRILRDSDNNTTQPSERIFDSEILKALHLMGIYDPTAVDLAQMEHITQEYIASWKLALKFGKVGEGGADIPLAIHLMAQNAPAPEVSQAEQDAEICEVCGNSSIGHGGKNCAGKYFYDHLGKRITE